MKYLMLLSMFLWPGLGSNFAENNHYSFSVVGKTETISVIKFLLINTDAEVVIREIQDGEVINLATLPTRNINIQAVTSPETVGSVVFFLNGSKKIENFFPYALKGDIKGNFHPWTPALGRYVLIATPYSSVNGSGTKGIGMIMHFEVRNEENSAPIVQAMDDVISDRGAFTEVQINAFDPDGEPLTFSATELPPGLTINKNTGLISGTVPIDPDAGSSTVFGVTVTAKDLGGLEGSSSFTWIVIGTPPEGKVIRLMIVNADTDKDIRELNFLGINLAELPTKKINIRAITVPEEVGSVKFELNNISRIENFAPYALKGDRNGNFHPWTPELGNYILTATSYGQPNAAGTPGYSIYIEFTVINDPSILAKQFNIESEQMLEIPKKDEFIAYPNPFSQSTSIAFYSEGSEFVNLVILNARGELINTLFKGNTEKSGKYTFTLDGNNLEQGMYYGKLITAKGIKLQRLFVVK